jgi:hypothetical protein
MLRNADGVAIDDIPVLPALSGSTRSAAGRPIPVTSESPDGMN